MNFSGLANVTLALTAVVYGVLATIASLAGRFGIWLAILLALSLWRYCYEVLRHFARGSSNIPPPDLESMNPVGEIVLILHFVAFPAVIALVSPLGPGGLILAIALAGVFPASAAVMGMTDSISSSLNPTAIIWLIKGLGEDYILLVLGCVAITVAVLVVDNVVLVHVGFLSRILSMMLGIWAMLAVFALIGSVLHKHRLDFEIPGDRPTDEERDLVDRDKAWRAMLDRAYASIRSGLADSGYQTLRDFLAENAHSPEAWYWLVENMFDWENKQHAVSVARRLISSELERGAAGAALDLYRRCRRRDPDFGVPPQEARTLAAFAKSIGQHGTASELSLQAAASDADCV